MRWVKAARSDGRGADAAVAHAGKNGETRLRNWPEEAGNSGVN